MSKKLTEEEAVEWLESNHPHIKLKSWGGSGSKISTFFSIETGYEFSDSFVRVRGRLKRGIRVGNRRTKQGSSEDLHLAIKQYLKENCPHIVLKQCADKISDKSLFYNKETDREFWFSFSNIKYQINNGYDIGVGLKEAGHRTNAVKQTPEEVAREWLNKNCPHLELVHWSGTWSDESVFYNSLLDKEITASLKNIKVTHQRGGIPFSAVSSLEVTVESWLNEWGVNFVYNRKLDGCSYKPDFLLPDHKLIIECDGLYWHSDENLQDKKYHLNKKNIYSYLGYRSLFFRCDEINGKESVVKSIISNALFKNEHRVFARKCTIKPITSEFFDLYHLMGRGSGNCFGLFQDDVCVAAIQVRWVNKSTSLLDVSRFCVKPYTSVVGGFSKLLKHVENLYEPNIIQTFIDRRYGDGYYLKNLGFSKKSCYPSFKWTDGANTFHRMKYPGNSGYEYGYNKIWDCGQTKWIKGTND